MTPVTAIPLSAIVESPDNPRKRFDPTFLEEMARSMRESGQFTPCLVRPHPKKEGLYELAAGATRLRAARQAGLETLDCAVRDMDDARFLEVLTFENLKRRDLQPMEEARSYALLQKRLEGWTVEKIAERSGVSPDYVRDRLRLLKLVPDAVTLLEAHAIELGHALELAKLASNDQLRAIADGLFVNEFAHRDALGVEMGLFGDGEPKKARSVRELKGWIAENVRLDLEHPEFRHLFPETARNIDAAVQARRKQVFIALGYVDADVKGGARVIAPTSWKRADGSKDAPSCEHAVLGIVRGGDRARGQSFLVCTAKEKCATHWKQWQKDRERAKKAGGLNGARSVKTTASDAFAREQARYERERVAREAREKQITAARDDLLTALVARLRKANPVTLLTALLEPGAPDDRVVRKALVTLPSRTLEDRVRVAAARAALGGFGAFNHSYTFDRHVVPFAKLLGVDVAGILKRHAPKPAEDPKSAKKAKLTKKERQAKKRAAGR